MKKLLVICTVFFLSLSALLFNGCDLKDILPIPSMTAKVNGDSWTSLFRASVMYISNNYFSVIGSPELSENADKVINISVYGRQPGTYELNPGTLTTECLIVYLKKAGAANGSSDYYVSTTATVTITKVDETKKTISGTFSGTLVESSGTVNDEVTITEGKFENLTYQEVQ